MGIDDLAMEWWARGWRDSDKLICTSCGGGDHIIQNAIAEATQEDEVCSFCGDQPAATFDVFMEAFMVGVGNAFEQADNAGMPWEGGYVFTTFESYEIPDEFDWVAEGEYADLVVNEIRECMEEKTYASRWWLELEPHKAYSSAWQEFQRQILHRTRFVFWLGKDDSADFDGAGEVSVAKVLESIAGLFDTFDLITTLPPGSEWYRARGHSERNAGAGWKAADLGTNLPDHSTSSSRMSPAGIPLFYGAADLDTALREVAHADERPFFTVGRFRSTSSVVVLDLTKVPPTPSIFDPEFGRWEGQLRFLNDFVQELRQPVEPTRSNLDYVSTQVFCEYMLRVARDGNITGLQWTSATGDGTCVALDIAHEDCVAETDVLAGRSQLVLVEDSLTLHQRRTDEFRQL